MRLFARTSLALAVLIAVSSAAAAPKRAGKKEKKPVVTTPAPPVLEATVSDQVFDILEKGTRSGDMRARGASYYGLALLQRVGFDVQAYLLDGLKDPQAVVRLGVVRGLMHLQNPAYREPLVVLLGDRGLDYPTQLLPALDKLEPALAGEILADALLVPANKRKDELVRALLQRGGPLLLAGADAAAKKGGDAALAFKKAVPTLSPDEALQVFPKLLPVADAELKVAILAAAASFPGDVSLDFIKPMLKDKDAAVATEAAKTLALKGFADAVPVLLPAAKGDDQKARLDALFAIRHAATSAHLKELEPLLDPAMRMPPNVIGEVWGAFGHARDTSIATQLRAALVSTDGLLREAAVRWLGLMEGNRALATLQEKLLDGNPKVRENAALAMGDLESNEAIEALEKAMNDPVEPVRLAAVQSLARINDPRVPQILQFLVSDPNREVKLVAIGALARLKASESATTLNIALSDADPEVRESALRAMMSIDLMQGRAAFKTAMGWLPRGRLTDMARTMGRDFGAYLGIALEHSDEAVRAEALEAVKRLGPEIEMPLLQGLVAKSPYPAMKLAALQRLAELPGSGVSRDLQGILMDSEQPLDVKLDAVALLGKVKAKDAEDAIRVAMLDPVEALRVTAAISLLEVYTL
jgi:HEAT repeat protein